MDLNRMVSSLQANPNSTKMGMIASHLGVVRGTSLRGEQVKEVEVSFDPGAIERIVRETKEMPGIVELLVETSEGRLKVGDNLMAVMVGGDTREHVFPALMEAVDRIKQEAVDKKEILAE